MGCRSWVQIWPKYYHCNCCAVYTVVSLITAMYQESVVSNIKSTSPPGDNELRVDSSHVIICKLGFILDLDWMNIFQSFPAILARISNCISKNILCDVITYPYRYPCHHCCFWGPTTRGWCYAFAREVHLHFQYSNTRREWFIVKYHNVCSHSYHTTEFDCVL